MADMLADLRLALRTLARTPLFTALAVTLLALGVGAAVAVFSHARRRGCPPCARRVSIPSW